MLYIATKFVSGGDLADVLRRAAGPLAPGRAASFIEFRAAGPARAVRPTSPGLGPRPAGPPAQRPQTSLPAKPPPAAGQGGKLPLVSISAVIAALAAAAVLLLLFLLHGAH